MGTIIVSGILFLIVGSIIFRLVKNHKSGKTSCGCGCSKCSSCHGE